MKINFIILLLLVFSCTVPREASELKKSTKEWRSSPVVLHAWADSPFSGVFLTLRENGKFEHTSSGLFGSFEAGDWSHEQDTIKLKYLNTKQQVSRKQNFIVDRKTNTIFSEGDSLPVFRRMRITKK